MASDSKSDVDPTEPLESPTTHTRPDTLSRTRSWLEHAGLRAVSLPTVVSVVWLLAVVAVEPASAQVNVGAVYCGTVVERGIDMVFGAVAGLGLPVTLFYLVRGGVNYMRAGGRPQKKDEAREQVLLAGVGFGIVLFALAAPELIAKFGSQLGFGFSNCVRPF